MNIEKLKAARDYNNRDIDELMFLFENEKEAIAQGATFTEMEKGLEVLLTIRTLLDQAIERSESATAINAPDLSELKITEDDLKKLKWYQGTSDNYERRHLYVQAYNQAVDRLAPRIVRDGFVVVPMEPTKEMIWAGNRVGDWGFYESSLRCPDEGNPKDIYSAMIKAAKIKD